MSQHDRLVSAYLDFSTADPNHRVFFGVDRDLGELPDPSTEHAASRAAEARELLARARALSSEPADFDQGLDRQLMELSFERAAHQATHTWNGRTHLQQHPSASFDISEGIFLIFSNDPRPAGERLEDITCRIEAVPEFLEAMLGRLDTPVDRWVGIEQEGLEGLPQLLGTVGAWADELGWSDSARLRGASERAEQALESYASRLRGLPTTQNLHLEEADARRLVQLRGVEPSLEELHGMARDFLDETSRTIEALRARLVRKYDLADDLPTPELQRWLAARYRVDLGGGPIEGVLDRYQQERRRVLDFIRERDLFPIPESQDMTILRTPGFMEPSIPAGAMMAPPPLREGVRRSLVYLTLKPELVDEHTELSIPGMMIHEGIPGHHLQLAWAADHPSPVRRLYDSADWAEGWTTMLEDYMLDLGYMGELEDEARFCGKRGLARIGARVAIDLFFMTGERGFLEVGVDCDLSADDPFVLAGNLLQAVTGFVPDRVEAELNWYSVERGYPLSYLLGNHSVWAMKRQVEEHGALSGLDLDRAFHAAYLRAGNMPVAFLEGVLQHQGLLARAEH